jgi:hypothetical protein
MAATQTPPNKQFQNRRLSHIKKQLLEEKKKEKKKHGGLGGIEN